MFILFIVFRKLGLVIVSKLVFFNIFLFIKFFGIIVKFLLVVKEFLVDFFLFFDIIFKVFGGEEVILKGFLEEKMVLIEKNELFYIFE